MINRDTSRYTVTTCEKKKISSQVQSKYINNLLEKTSKKQIILA